MKNATSTSRSRWFTRLTAPLAGLALLGAGVGAAQAHDFDHHDRSSENTYRHTPGHRDHDHYREHYRDHNRRAHDRLDYGHRRYAQDDQRGWRGDHREQERRDYRDHRYVRDGRYDHDRGVFGRW